MFPSARCFRSRWLPLVALAGFCTADLAGFDAISAAAQERGAKRSPATIEDLLAEPTMKVGAGGRPAEEPGAGAKAGQPVRPGDGRSVAIEKLSGVWVEGPGYDVTYGSPYDTCAARCAASPKCVMIEYYRPEKKCNLYSNMRPRKAGGASFVGIKG